MPDIYSSPTISGNRKFRNYLNQYGATSGHVPSATMLDEIIQGELSQSYQNIARNRAFGESQRQFNVGQENAIDTADANRRAGMFNTGTQALTTGLTLAALTKPKDVGLLDYISGKGGAVPNPAPVSGPTTAALPSSPGLPFTTHTTSSSVGGPVYTQGAQAVQTGPIPGTDLTLGQTMNAQDVQDFIANAGREGLGREEALNLLNKYPANNIPITDVTGQGGVTLAGNTGTTAATVPPTTGPPVIANETWAPWEGGTSESASFPARIEYMNEAPAGAGVASEAGTTVGASPGVGVGTVAAYVAAADMARQKWGQLDRPYDERSPWAKLTSTPAVGIIPAVAGLFGKNESNYLVKPFSKMAQLEEKLVGEPLDKAFAGDIGGSLDSFYKAVISTPGDLWSGIKNILGI